MKRPIFKFLYPAGFGIGVFILLLVITNYVAYQAYCLEKEKAEQDIGEELNRIKDKLQTFLGHSLSATSTVAFWVERYETLDDFDAIAKTILISNPYIDAIQLTEKGVITHVYPLIGNEVVIGYDILADPKTNKEASYAIEKRELYFAGPFELKQGGQAVVGRLPIFKQNEFWGFSAVLINFEKLLEASGIDSNTNDKYVYQLSKINPNTGKEEFFLPMSDQFDASSATSIDVPDGEWKLYVAHRNNSGAFTVALNYAILGLILALVSGFLVWYIAKQPAKLARLVVEKTDQLSTSEKHFRALIENSSDAIVLLNASGQIIYQSPSTETITGYSVEELLQLNLISFIHLDDQDNFTQCFSGLLKSQGSRITQTHRLRKQNGDYITIEGTYTNLIHEKSVRAIIFNYHDISERIAAQERINLLNQLYVVVSRINRMMVSVPNEEKLFKEVCDITVDYGQLRMAWIGLVDENFSKIIPTVACGHEEGYLSIIKNISVDEPDLREGPTGRALRTGSHVICNDIASDPFMRPWAKEALARGYRSSMAIPFRKFGKVMGTLNLYASIPDYFNETEVKLLLETAEGISFTLENFEREKLRLRAEAELIKVYKEKETVLNRINDAVVSLDTSWRYTFLNDAAHSTHPPPEQTLGKTIWEIHPQLKGSVFESTYHLAMNTQTVQEVEAYHEPLKSWFFAKAYPSEDGLTIFFKDITERKLAERQIYNEKQISESIINSLPGIFYLYTREGVFTKWNKNFETVSGYTAEEISKSQPVDYFFADEKIRLAEKIKEVFNSGEGTITANFLSKNGTETPYYLTGRKIILDQVEYLIGMGIDIADRVFAENELIKRNKQILELTKNLEKIREEERTRIAREIHDELGQQLTALKMDAAWVQKKISSSQPESDLRLSDMMLLIDETIKSVRRISSELRPSILDDLGLIAALEWQSEDFSKRTAIHVTFRNKVSDFNPDPNTATQVFRIFQESLTNIARHAEATEISILLEQDESNMLLHITDNGKGFDTEEIGQRKTLGMLGMRERTLLFNGELTIKTAAGKGTKVTLKIPPQQN